MTASSCGEPQNVGICGMELYFPRTFVEQADLETYDGASSGKYTKGLGQQQMGFCGDHEDVASLCLTVLANLLENYSIDRKSVGFLCVGTETLIDKSKGVKTQLMELFGSNTDIEGVDVKNACYGGTQAVFHAVDWVYANWRFEHRYAIVVMGDIAVYEPGAARCTGGAGAFAALIGPNALISFERGLRATHMSNTWDFYKPIVGPSSEFPCVDGPVSLKAYLMALDSCYDVYREKARSLLNDDCSVASFDAVLFHSPFCRLVQKAFARLAFADFVGEHHKHLKEPELLQKFLSVPRAETLVDRSFADASLTVSAKLWEARVSPNLLFNRRVGNMYTSSLYAQLFAMLHRSTSLASILGSRILMFSYGSGSAAALFSARIRGEHGLDLTAECQYLQMKLSAESAVSRLDARIPVSPVRYTEILATREKLLLAKVPYVPMCLESGDDREGTLADADTALFAGTYYLKRIDEKFRRTYARIGVDDS